MTVLHVPPLTLALWANYKYKQLGDTEEMNDIFTKLLGCGKKRNT